MSNTTTQGGRVNFIIRIIIFFVEKYFFPMHHYVSDINSWQASLALRQVFFTPRKEHKQIVT